MKLQRHNRYSESVFHQQKIVLITLFLLLLSIIGYMQEFFTFDTAYAQNAPSQPAVTAALVPELTVVLANSQIKPGAQSMVTATLRDRNGQPVVGELVVFFGGLGTVNPPSAITDAQGRVSAVYTAGTRSGVSRVTVLAGYATNSTSIQVIGSQPGAGFRVYLPTISR